MEVGERQPRPVGEAKTLGVRLVPPDLRSNWDPRTPASQIRNFNVYIWMWILDWISC